MRISHALIALILLAWLGLARAHDLPVNRMVNAIVKVESGRADMIVRVPADLLRGVPFPTKNGRYDLSQAGPTLELAQLLLADAFVLQEDGRKLTPRFGASRLVPSSDRSFDRYEHAAAELDAPFDAEPPIPVDTGFLMMHLSWPIASASSRLEFQAWVNVDVGVPAPVTLRFQRGNEPVRAMIVGGGADPVDLDPAWYRAAGGFVLLGIDHILSGTDHLLFLLCLIVPVRRVRDILPVITAFTLAHSVTLIASAMGIAPRGAWFPPLVEAAIAASIIYTAAENMLAKVERRWVISCVFGLVHGFGFSNALGDSLQFAGRHLVVALLAFNIGIETGQLGVLCAGVPVLVLLVRWFGRRRVVLATSALGAAIALVWLVERWQVLRQADSACGAALCIDRAAAWAIPAGVLAGLGVMLVLAARRWHGNGLFMTRTLNEDQQDL